jgi:uncharacterized C2H2 Zn-finger protein
VFKTENEFFEHICKKNAIEMHETEQSTDDFENECINDPSDNGSHIKCQNCKKLFKSQKGYGKHVCKGGSKQVSNQIRCRRCSHLCKDRQELNLHIRETHMQRGRGATPTMEFDDLDLKNFYNKYNSYIFDHHELGQPQSFYNFPIDHHFSINDLMSHVNEIYNNQSQSFKINMSFGVILQNSETNEYRYFKAYSNDGIFTLPISISNRTDLENFRTRLSEIDVTDRVNKNRPNTKWKLVLVTNVRY